MAAKDDWDLFNSVAEMLGLEPDETENFVTSAMRRRGHKPTINWADDEEGDGDKGGDFFTRKREKRQVSGRQQRGGGRDQSSGSGWQYG
jgi:hypothetical protein